jgi:glycosyltransferase involved in cell wall biosynthesis
LLDSSFGRRLVARHDLDVMHFAGNVGWGAVGPVPVVLTIHDLIFLEPGGRGTTLRQRAGRRYMRWNVARAAAHADQVIAVSHDTAAAIARQGWALANPARVVHHGVQTPAAVGSAPSPRDFVIFGASDPRKNLALAIGAFEDATVRLPAGTRLHVFAGAGLDDRLRRRVAASPAAITVHGYLERAELSQRMADAIALLHPTTAEGFGLPVLDAMAAGVPVIGGLTAAGRELADAAMLSLDPHRPHDSLRDAMLRVAHEPGLRDDLARAGRERAATFSWARCADEHVAAYREAVMA